MEAELTRIGKSVYVRMAVLLYFIAGAVEVYLEMQRNTAAIYLIKPLLMPLLLTVYVLSVKSRDISYIAALVFSWIANIFFISPDYASIFTGAMFFFVFRVLTIYIVFKRSGPPRLFPLLVSCIPFFFVYAYLAWHIHHRIGDGLWIFIGQCVLITFLGGLFAVTQFIFAGKVFYIQEGYFHALAMALYVPGQYLFLKYLLLSAKAKSRS